MRNKMEICNTQKQHTNRYKEQQKKETFSHIKKATTFFSFLIDSFFCLMLFEPN